MTYEEASVLYRNPKPFRSTRLNADVTAQQMTQPPPPGRRYVITELLVSNINPATPQQMAVRLIGTFLNYNALLEYSKNETATYSTLIEVPLYDSVIAAFINGRTTTDITIAGWEVDSN